MTVCLSPNGSTVFKLRGPATDVLAGTIDGIVRLQSSGDSWRVADKHIAGQHISSLLVEPTRGGLFAGIHGEGLYFSADQGHTWQPRITDLGVKHVYSLGCTQRDGKIVIYAGTEPSHLFESTDYGESWQELATLRQVPEMEKWMFPAPPHTGHVKCIAVDPRDTRTVYAGIEQGALLKTTDGGKTWREQAGYSRPDDEVFKDVHRVLLRPSNPDEIYMSGGMGLYYSPDAGETWEHLTDRKFRIGYPDQLLFSPNDDRVLFMSGASDNPGTWRQSHQADATVVRSRDSGRSWEPAGGGLPEHMRGNIEAMSMGVYGDSFSLFAATTDGDIFASHDGAESWTRIASGLAPVSKVGHYMPPRAA